MEVLAILFAAGIFVSLIWPEKQQQPPKQEDLLAKALKKWMDEGGSVSAQGDTVRGSGR
ncbi:MAG: hypothetical protein ACFB0C_01965 [Leptolyngbyaceae cyanobacterium]